MISSQGQAELTNYRTVKVPSNVEIPVFIKDEFGDFYEAIFTNTYKRENQQVAILEYAWSMNWCDPCAANPLNSEELKQAGVFWLNDSSPNNVFLTRLHVRYHRDRFPEDLVFQQTNNQQFFQGRYVITHSYTNEIGQTCPEDIEEIVDEIEEIKNETQLLRLVRKEYVDRLTKRQEAQVQNLARLTGWDVKDIRNRVDYSRPKSIPWWKRIWQ